MLCPALKRHACPNSTIIHQFCQYSAQSAHYRPLSSVGPIRHPFASQSPFTFSNISLLLSIFSGISSIRLESTHALGRLRNLNGKRRPPTNQRPVWHATGNLNHTMSHAVKYQADIDPPFCSLNVKDTFEQVSIFDLLQRVEI